VRLAKRQPSAYSRLMRNLSRKQLLAELRALRPEFEREGVAHMSLFGSRARGDNRPDSDVDIVVDVAAGRNFGLEAVGVFNLIESRIGLPASIVTRPGLSHAPGLGDRISRDEVTVF
jgi:predicted nucleotidyltransferase